MVDPETFAYAQRMVWVKHLLDPQFISFWKNIEEEFLISFYVDKTVLFKAKCVFNKIQNCQLRYKEIFLIDFRLNNFHLQDFLWWNKKVSFKHRPYFYYPIWLERGISQVLDLYQGHRVKTFEELVIEYDLPIRDRRKYESLLNGIYLSWFDNATQVDENVYDKIVRTF